MPRSLVCVGVLLSVMSCAQDPPSSPPTDPDNRLTPGAIPEDLAGYALVEEGLFTLDELLRTHDLAQALAKAIGDAALRASIRNAMRASPHAEHKLLFQDFASDPRYGEQLRRALDTRGGLNSKELDGLLAVIPPLDFYLPWIEHRQTWQATPEVVVGATLDVNDPLYDAYTTDGIRQARDARASGPPSVAVLFLHPAERKFPRRDGTSGVGEVVQDPGPVPSLAVPSSHRGELTPAQDCQPGTPGCGGGGGSNYPLVLESFEYFYEGDAFGQGEIEFNIYYVVNGTVQKSAFLYYGGDDCEDPHQFCTPHTVIWPSAPPLSSTRYISVDPHEEDYPKDEHWGEQFHGYAPTFTSASQLGQLFELVDELCSEYFNDDDHGELFSQFWGLHDGGACHHGFPFSDLTSIMVYTIAIDS